MIPILFLTGIFFLNFLARIIFSPLMPALETDLGIGHGEAGSLFLLISIGYFITLVASGFFSSRLLHRGTIVLSGVSVGVALLLASLTREIWGFRVALLILGMAAGLYLPSGIATLTALTDAKHWGRALAVHEMAPNLGFMAAPVLSEALLLCLPWRWTLAVLGLASIGAGVVYASGEFGGRFPGRAPSAESFKPLARERSFWAMMILFGLGIGASLGIFTMLPLYLVTEHGLGRGWSNTLVSLSRVLGVAAAFAAGWASDRFGPKRTIETVLLLTGLATVMLGIAKGTILLIAVFLQPLLAVCFFPPGFAVLSRLGSESNRNLVVSVTIPAAFILGGGAIPILIGTLGDAGAFSHGIGLVGGLIVAGALLPRLVTVSGEGPS